MWGYQVDLDVAVTQTFLPGVQFFITCSHDITAVCSQFGNTKTKLD